MSGFVVWIWDFAGFRLLEFDSDLPDSTGFDGWMCLNLDVRLGICLDLGVRGFGCMIVDLPGFGL